MYKRQESERFAEEIEKVKADAELSEEDAKKKQADIEEIEKTILASDDTLSLIHIFAIARETAALVQK